MPRRTFSAAFKAQECQEAAPRWGSIVELYMASCLGVTTDA
jgi:hypothetical protein